MAGNMKLLTSLSIGQIWVVLLGVAIMIAALTAIVAIVVAWRDRPIKKDEAVQYKLQQRLQQITEHAAVQPRKSFGSGAV